jgi:hypothetical protein
LKEHPDLATEIEAKIRAAVGIPVPGARASAAADE